ncbi:MAG TPA: PBP1A family penicillin-binding protein [Thermoanaerobaculia bacterium]|jgi:penicillin-binding protein 1B|nr:PBP1A family penicillin-binding protein [Thermoanaerobaculia bacterium]
MPDFTPRLPTRRTVFRTIGILFAIFVLAILGLGIYAYKQSVGKFELRRLSLPTRIFADAIPLRPGVAMSPDDLLTKLDRLGYREAKSGVAQPGDFARGGNQIDVYLRAFVHPPTGSYPAQPVRITFGDNGIATVVSLRDKTNAPNVALEPELLTSILSDQLENRRPVTLDQVPQSLQDAVVVTEDVRFWHHPGVDPIGMFRALFRNVRAGGVAQGASTLTQQLVKNYYFTDTANERTFKRKIPEIFMAVILDAKYSKREILEAYLNDIYLGRNRSISIMGVGEAAHFYFGKPVTDLNPAESAMLAGMIRSPNNYSPFNNPDKAIERRNTVLGLMLNNKKIDRAAYDKAMNTPLPQRPYRDRSGLGSIPFYVDCVLQEMARDYGIKDVKGRGLQIYTAIDFAAQDAAARTLAAGLAGLEKGNRRLRRDDPQKILQGVLIHVDVPTGEIRALVGGRNYDVNQFNRALNSKRLIGSLVKPFVYLTAFEPSLSQQNITPATLVSDTRFVLKRKFAADWSPRNYDDNYHGTVTVQEALEQSLNSASVRIGLASGLDAIIKTMHTLGINTDVENNPALLLGAAGIPPIEMADAYSTIARVGSRLPLRTIRYVTNDRGKVISAGDDIKPVQVFPARDTFMLVNTMKGPIDRGTAYVVRRMGFKKIAAGKTGTTNDKRDAWFIGFTPQTLALVWVGFDDNTPTGLAGGEGAAPIWGRYMLQVANAQPNADFVAPPGVTMVQIDETSGGVATANCPANLVVTAAFKSGTEPTIPCPIHSPQPSTPMMTTDQFGNPIALDTAQPTSTEGSVTTTDTGPPPDSTLTGGVFRTDTTGTKTDTTNTAAAPPPTNTDTTSTTTTSPPP